MLGTKSIPDGRKECWCMGGDCERGAEVEEVG